jgi:hypothetical protein
VGLGTAGRAEIRCSFPIGFASGSVAARFFAGIPTILARRSARFMVGYYQSALRAFCWKQQAASNGKRKGKNKAKAQPRAGLLTEIDEP